MHDAHEALGGQKTPPSGVRSGSLVDPAALPVLQGRQVRLWTPPRCASSLLRRRDRGRRRRTRSRGRRRRRRRSRRARYSSKPLLRSGKRDYSSSATRERGRRGGRGRTPRTSSYSSRGCAHRRQRQWHFQSWLRWFCAYAVSSSLVDRPKLLDIMDGMDQNDSIHCARRRLWLWHMQSWFCWYCTSRCVPPVVFQPQMLRIMAGVYQKDSYALFGPGSGICKARLLVCCTSRSVPPVVFSPWCPASWWV